MGIATLECTYEVVDGYSNGPGECDACGVRHGSHAHTELQFLFVLHL